MSFLGTTGQSATLENFRLSDRRLEIQAGPELQRRSFLFSYASEETDDWNILGVLVRRSALRNESSKLGRFLSQNSVLARLWLTANPVERFLLLVKFGGGVTFLRGFRQQYEEKAGVRYGVWFAPFRLWGTRAEDPFRGLRAGPVRSSPFTLSLIGPRSYCTGVKPPKHPNLNEYGESVSLENRNAKIENRKWC
jgi:hypothetical protein